MALLQSIAWDYGDSALIAAGCAGLVHCHCNKQILEYPDMVGDLARGLVRRRAIFQWNYGYEGMPPQGEGAPRATLVKIDRSGGGQVPEGEADFFRMV